MIQPIHGRPAPANGRARPLVLVLLILASLSALPARAQLSPPTDEERFSEAFRLFSDELYGEASRELAAFRRSSPDHVQAAAALYYQAEAELALGHEDEAVRLFTRFERRYPTHPLAAQARLALGKFFFETERYDRAAEVFEQILADGPPDELAAKALYWTAEAALRQGREDRALTYFRRAAEEYRATATAPTALYAIGFTQVRQGRYDEAAEAFEVLAARHPDSPYARDIGLALAEVYYELEDYERAAAEIDRRMPSLGPEARERATFLLAESYNQLRRSEDAIVQYNRIVDNYPDGPYARRALYGLGWNYYFEGVHQWAAEHFARVREGRDDPLAADATYYQAVNEKLAQKPFEAIDLFRAYVQTWPDGELASHARFELAVSLYEQRMWREAREAFTDVVEQHPGTELAGEAFYLRGNTAVALNDFPAAESDFERAIQADAAPASLRGDIAFQQAWLRYRNDRFEEAARDFMALHEAAPTSQKGGDALFWAAESNFQLDRFGRAEALFERYLREFRGGKHVDAAHYALGWTHFRQGDYGAAADQFQRFLEDYRVSDGFVPYRTDALLRLADSYYALKRYPEAVRIYQQVAEQAGDYALYQVGQAYYNAGDAYEAINAFRRLLDEYRDSQWAEETLYTLGYIYFQNQDYEQAVETYREVIETYPRDPIAAKAQYGIGDALYNAGRPEDAVQAYVRVLERYPNSAFVADAASGIQYALAALGDEARAEAIIEDFAAAHPDSPLLDELRFRQAEVAYQSGRLDEAMAAFERFVRTAQNDALLSEAYYYLGSIRADRGQGEAAEQHLRRIIDTYPSSERFAEAARRLGHLYLDARRFEAALNVFERLEAARPRDERAVAEARYGQGVALLNLGRTERAERLLRESIDAAPDASETMPAYLGLARVYEGTGRTGEAADLYRRLVGRSRDEVGAEALYRLGALLLGRGDARRAIEELSRMPVLFAGYGDWVARSYLAQARAFQLQGERGEALRLYDRVVEEFGDTPFAETARQEKEAL